MAKLSKGARSKLSASTFAGPNRSYPIPDKGHAKAAKIDASRAVNSGRMSVGMEKRIDAKANRKLGK